MARGLSPAAWIGLIGGAALLGVVVEKEIGVKITSVAYGAGPGSKQVTAKVTLANHTSSQSTYTLAGYQVRQQDVARLAPPTLGLSFLRSPESAFAKITAAGLVEGHWFSQPNIQASGPGPVNPTLANQERAIPATVPRGGSVQISAYTATPEDITAGIVNFWFVFPGSGVLSGVPAASWLDPSPEMPSV